MSEDCRRAGNRRAVRDLRYLPFAATRQQPPEDQQRERAGFGDGGESLRIVRRGGLIMADNAFAFGELFDENPSDAETPAVRALNEHIATDKRLPKVIVPLGDGCWVGVKL